MNVVVITALSCRARSLGAYGDEFTVTANLDRLAAEGEVFDRHYAETTEIAKCREHWWNPEALAQFDERVLIRCTRVENDAPIEGYSQVHTFRDDGDLVEALPAILEALPADSPWLLWIESDALLPPWEFTDELFEAYCEDLEEAPETIREPHDDMDRETLQRSYSAAVTAFDTWLGQLFDLLREYPVTWAFTAAGGFALGEHGEAGIDGPPHAELAQVPMMVRRPEENLTRLAALATLSEAERVQAPPLRFGEGAGGVRSSSLGDRTSTFTQHADFWPILLGQPLAEHPHAITRSPGGAAIRTGTHTLIVPTDGEPRLYELPGDSWEANDVRSSQIDLADDLEKHLL